MEFRKVFDTIPEQFDKYRPRYSAELFADLIEYAEIGPGKSVLELGPGTGQATDPILNTGCDYNCLLYTSGFLLNLNVFTKPLNGFTNAFAQVTLTKLISNDRCNS